MRWRSCVMKIFVGSRLSLPQQALNHDLVRGISEPPSPPPPTVPVDSAARGLGPAGSVAIPPQTWDNVVQASSLQAMGDVQLPRAEVAPIVAAMTQALHRQGHLVRTEKGMPGWGTWPSAPVFDIPKSDVKCSFIMNCKEGSKRDPNPQPSMRLPNMWSLRRRLLAWKGSKDAHVLNIFACTFDLSNCFTSCACHPRPGVLFGFRGRGLACMISAPFPLARSCPCLCAKPWWAPMCVRLLIL